MSDSELPHLLRSINHFRLKNEVPLSSHEYNEMTQQTAKRIR